MYDNLPLAGSGQLNPEPIPESPAALGSGTGTGYGSRGEEVRDQIQKRLNELSEARRKKLPPPADPCPGFTLLHHIGSGSYGSVWEAMAKTGSARVAIKFFPAVSGSTLRITDEVSHIRSLGFEEGFVGVQNDCPDATWPYYVMSQVAKNTLEKYLGAGRKVDGPTARQCFEKLVRSMGAAHSRKPPIVHCDLKPSNVLLLDEQDLSKVLISDFGQAQLSQKKQQVSLGTFFYMPPEQAKAYTNKAEPWWDVYALGATCYAMLHPKHHPPRCDGWEESEAQRQTRHHDERLERYRDQLKKREALDLVELRPDVDADFIKVIERCLALDPNDRYRDASAVQDALRKMDRKRKRHAILVPAVLCTLGLMAVLAVAGWFARNRVVEDHQRTLVDGSRKSQQELANVCAELLKAKLESRIRAMNRLAREFYADGDCMAELQGAVDKRAPEGFVIALAQWPPAERQAVTSWLSARFDDPEYRPTIGGRSLACVIHQNRKAFLFSHVHRSANDPTATRIVMDPSSDPEAVTNMNRNLSWRDWFSGAGIQEEKALGKHMRHEPVKSIHISTLYLSKSDARWAMDISVPIFSHQPGQAGEVIGMLVSGIDVDRELVRWLDTKNENYNVTILNDRNYVIYHDHLKDLLTTWNQSESNAKRWLEAFRDSGGKFLPAPGGDLFYEPAPWNNPEQKSPPPPLEKHVVATCEIEHLTPLPWKVHVDCTYTKITENSEKLASRLLLWGVCGLGAFGTVAALGWWWVSIRLRTL